MGMAMMENKEDSMIKEEWDFKKRLPVNVDESMWEKFLPLINTISKNIVLIR